MDHIRDVCEGNSSLDVPMQNDPDEFSGYFEASVRKSLNAHRSNMDKYVRDRETFGGSSAHPQLTNVTDGYAEGLRIDGEHVPDVVTSIIESKFTRDVSGQLSYNQSTTHIDDLAKAYGLSPTGDLLYAPTYVIDSNSQYEDVEGLGRYGSGQERDLPDYGAMQGVNVMHLRVTKSTGGQFYLEGDLLGSPAKVIDWIGDMLSDEKTPFRVSCSP